MKKSNKLSIFISTLSILVIGGSVYYYNDALSKKKTQIEQELLTTTTTASTTVTEAKLNMSEKNVKISTEVKEDKIVVINLENISGRSLTDIVLEADYKGTKLTEVFIANLEKGSKKKIEVPLEKQLLSNSIKNNETIINEYRLLETAEFKVGESVGNILVTSIKSQTKEFYKEKVLASTLEQSIKDELVKKIESLNDVFEIEKLLKENKIIPELRLSDDHLIFKDGESELKIESTTETTTTSNSSESTTVTVVGGVTSVQNTSTIYGVIPYNNTPSSNRNAGLSPNQGVNAAGQNNLANQQGAGNVVAPSGANNETPAEVPTPAAPTQPAPAPEAPAENRNP